MRSRSVAALGVVVVPVQRLSGYTSAEPRTATNTISFPDGPCSVSCRFGLETPCCDAGHAPWSSGGVVSAFHDSLRKRGGRVGALPCAKAPAAKPITINAANAVTRPFILFLRNSVGAGL